jgi:transcriptional regulator with XRE-family HTH domain
MSLTDSRIKLWLQVSKVLAIAAKAGARRVAAALHRRRPYPCRTRRPGTNTPMWNVCVILLRQELRKYGAKAQLARYLGVPRQRLQDYLKARSRLPDAELMLRLLHWLTERRAGRDPAL